MGEIRGATVQRVAILRVSPVTRAYHAPIRNLGRLALALVTAASLFAAGVAPAVADGDPVPAIQVVPVGDYVDLLHWAPGPVMVTVNGVSLVPAPDGGDGDVRVSLGDYGIDLVAEPNWSAPPFLKVCQYATEKRRCSFMVFPFTTSSGL